MARKVARLLEQTAEQNKHIPIYEEKGVYNFFMCIDSQGASAVDKSSASTQKKAESPGSDSRPGFQRLP